MNSDDQKWLTLFIEGQVDVWNEILKSNKINKFRSTKLLYQIRIRIFREILKPSLDRLKLQFYEKLFSEMKDVDKKISPRSLNKRVQLYFDQLLEFMSLLAFSKKIQKLAKPGGQGFIVELFECIIKEINKFSYQDLFKQNNQRNELWFFCEYKILSHDFILIKKQYKDLVLKDYEKIHEIDELLLKPFYQLHQDISMKILKQALDKTKRINKKSFMKSEGNISSSYAFVKELLAIKYKIPIKTLNNKISIGKKRAKTCLKWDLHITE